MNRAALYARVSSERQRERHTIASQLSLLPTIIAQKGYCQVAEPYIDDGISGETLEDRPAMTRLLEDAERLHFDAVFVVDIDRLTRARKSIDWEIIKDTFRKARVKVITPSQEYDFENEDQEFISDIFSRISAYEKKKILRRLMRGKWEKTRQGKFVGGKLPYGYSVDEETKTYYIVETEAEAIRYIFRLCLEGYSLERIQSRMNELGYPTPVDIKGYNHRRKSNAWAKSSVQKILANERYTGEFSRWTTQIVGHNLHRKRPESEWLKVKIPAIITPLEFARAQEALKSRKALAKRNAKRLYLLSGLLYCASCGTKMVGECYAPSIKHRRKEERYYVCWNGRRKTLERECPLYGIKAQVIEDTVWDEVSRLLRNPALLKQAILQAHTSIDTLDEEAITSLMNLLNSKDTEEERLLDLYQVGTVNKEKLERRLESVRKERDVIRQNINLLKNRTQLARQLQTLQELSLTLQEDVDRYDFAQKQRALKFLFWGTPEAGVFLSENRMVDLKGIIDFTQLQIFKNNGIETTLKAHCDRRRPPPLRRV